MSDQTETFTYHPEPERTHPLLAEGATEGWLVLHEGVGPARAVRVVAVTDDEGSGFVERTGEWQDVTVTDD